MLQFCSECVCNVTAIVTVIIVCDSKFLAPHPQKVVVPPTSLPLVTPLAFDTSTNDIATAHSTLQATRKWYTRYSSTVYAIEQWLSTMSAPEPPFGLEVEDPTVLTGVVTSNNLI